MILAFKMVCNNRSESMNLAQRITQTELHTCKLPSDGNAYSMRFDIENIGIFEVIYPNLYTSGC